MRVHDRTNLLLLFRFRSSFSLLLCVTNCYRRSDRGKKPNHKKLGHAKKKERGVIARFSEGNIICYTFLQLPAVGMAERTFVIMGQQPNNYTLIIRLIHLLQSSQQIRIHYTKTPKPHQLLCCGEQYSMISINQCRHYTVK